MKCDNDIFDPNFQSKLDDFFKSFSIETRRGGWFRYFDKELARSCLSGNVQQKREANRLRSEASVEA